MVTPSAISFLADKKTVAVRLGATRSSWLVRQQASKPTDQHSLDDRNSSQASHLFVFLSFKEDVAVAEAIGRS